MALIDFSNCTRLNTKLYGGSNGSKIGILYNNQKYLLKFSSKDCKGQYTSSVISEYIACHIFSLLGFKTQETLLGTYFSEKDHLVVACKDFTEPNKKFYDFASLKNSIISSSKLGFGTDLSDVLTVIDEQTLYNKDILKKFFWQMFIVDSFVGNFDRHNGNWGFLINNDTNKVEIAPIFDCASCLYPKLEDEKINNILNDENEIEKRVFVFPNSASKRKIKINPYFYINSFESNDCSKALFDIFPKIDMNKIENLIDEIPCISDLRKKFYKTILNKRYELILKPAYDLINENKFLLEL